MATRGNPLLDRGLKMQCKTLRLYFQVGFQVEVEKGAGEGTGRELQEAGGQRAERGSSKKAEAVEKCKALIFVIYNALKYCSA